MDELESLDQQLAQYRSFGPAGLGAYASACLRYADAVERRAQKRIWRTGDGDYTANEYLQSRIVQEFITHGLVGEGLQVAAQIHRAEFAQRVRGNLFRDLAKTGIPELYWPRFESFLSSLSGEDVSDLLTGAELCGQLGRFELGTLLLEHAFDKLQSRPEQIFQWDGFANILFDYPENKRTFELARRAWDVIGGTNRYGRYKTCAFLSLFEEQSSEVAEILRTLPTVPEHGATVSTLDMVMRFAPLAYAARDNPIKAAALLNRIHAEDTRRYTLNDLLRQAERFSNSGQSAQAEQLLLALRVPPEEYREFVAAEAADAAKSAALTQSAPETKTRPRTPRGSAQARRARAQALVEQARKIGRHLSRTPKLEATKQITILEKVLALNELPLAWEVLQAILDTLEQVPAFSKHEYRAMDVVRLLEPYAATHPKLVQEFTTEFLRRDSRRSYWQTVHGLSAVLPLMLALGGAKPLEELAAFLTDWPNGEK